MALDQTQKVVLIKHYNLWTDFEFSLIWIRSTLDLMKMYKVTQKTGTFEMRSGSHVQLAALRNRDLQDLQDVIFRHW